MSTAGAGRPPRTTVAELPGYVFRQELLLQQALTHRSHGGEHNERLEFLGDAVLGLLMAELLYHRFPDADPGQLSRMRSVLVDRIALTRLAGQLALSARLRVSPGAGAPSADMLGDAVEALIGALYLDAGWSRARRVVLRWYDDELSRLTPQSSGKDAKTELQEYLQAHGHPLPVYHVLGEHGKPHEREYTVLCEAQGIGRYGAARAHSKGRAERQAAAVLLGRLAGQVPAEVCLRECLQLLGHPPPTYSVTPPDDASPQTVRCELSTLQRSVLVQAEGTTSDMESLAAGAMLAQLCTQGVHG